MTAPGNGGHADGLVGTVKVNRTDSRQCSGRALNAMSGPSPGVAPIRSIQDEKAKRGANISQGGICCLTRSRSAALNDLQHIAGITSERAATLSDWR
jgi:hypothetical protein